MPVKRIFLIVLDSFGIGNAPDAEAFGDKGADTLRSVSRSEFFNIPNLTALGLPLIEGADCAVFEKSEKNNSELCKKGLKGSAVCRLVEKSKGKDTTIGHWEIAGIVSEKPLPVYPEGFSHEVIEEFSRRTGRKVLCNKPYSGTEVIKDYGEEHVKTGALIV
jgi:phosphopentomutase